MQMTRAWLYYFVKKINDKSQCVGSNRNNTSIEQPPHINGLTNSQGFQ